MIGIIDYGMGNLRSVLKAIEFLGGEGRVTARAEELDACEKLILPGVGSFGAGMENLRRGGLDEYVRRRAAEGTPLLGICLGMQFLLEESEEEGLFQGLGLVKGRVVPFTEGKIPHMGWNAVEDMRGPLFDGIPSGTQFYFVHSYFADTAEEYTLGKTEYYRTFASAVGKNNVFGVQFHPEKSGAAGLQLLRNYMRL